jgi:hypothetical protein
MNKPNTPYPNSPTTAPSQMPINIPDFSLKGESFDQLLRNRGIRFIHHKATTCPNMTTIADNSHNPNCPICDGQGMYYYEEREIFGIFYSNSIEKNFEMQGIWEVGTAIVTLPTEYADGTQAEFNSLDQLSIPDFTVRMWQLKEYEVTPSGQQQLRYPIYNVDYMASAKNDAIIEYVQGVNFNIVNGNIEWIAGQTPLPNDKGLPAVLTIQYFANPTYTVVQHMRELRVTQQLMGAQKVSKRLPQQILVKRDYLYNAPERT